MTIYVFAQTCTRLCPALAVVHKVIQIQFDLLQLIQDVFLHPTFYVCKTLDSRQLIKHFTIRKNYIYLSRLYVSYLSINYLLMHNTNKWYTYTSVCYHQNNRKFWFVSTLNNHSIFNNDKQLISFTFKKIICHILFNIFYPTN